MTFNNLPQNSNATFVWVIEQKDQNGDVVCHKESDVVTISNMSYVATVTTKEQVICKNYFEGLTATDVVTGYNAEGWWTADKPNVYFGDVSTTTATSSKSYKINAYNLPYGQVEFTWHVKGGNCDEETDKVVITNESVKVAADITDAYTCNGTYSLETDIPTASWQAVGHWDCVSGDDKETVDGTGHHGKHGVYLSGAKQNCEDAA